MNTKIQNTKIEKLLNTKIFSYRKKTIMIRIIQVNRINFNII